MTRLEVGFETQDRLLLSFDLSRHGYDNERTRPFVRQALDQIRGLPGVRSATISHSPPFGYENSSTLVHAPEIEGEARIDLRYRAWFAQVAPDYFRTMGIPLLAGRGIEDSDRLTNEKVIVVNQALANKYWPGENPLGKRLGILGSAKQPSMFYRVVGLAADSKYDSITDVEQPYFYFALDQRTRTALTFIVHATGDAESMLRAVRQQVGGLDPTVSLFRLNTMEGYLGRALQGPRVITTLLSGFGLLALALAAVGVYGLVSHSVSWRTREVGIRMALGASSENVVRLVVAQGLTLALIGTVVGLVLAVGASQLASGFLFGVSPSDPAAFVGTVLVLLSATAVASLVPAWRASRVDPMKALRYE